MDIMRNCILNCITSAQQGNNWQRVSAYIYRTSLDEMNIKFNYAFSFAWFVRELRLRIPQLMVSTMSRIEKLQFINDDFYLFIHFQ